MSKTRILDDVELIEEILEVLEQMDSEDLAEVHNKICANRAETIEENKFKISVIL